MRRRRRLPLEVLTPYLLEVAHSPGLDAAPALWNLSEIFGNDRPVELEVGFGKGLFLLNVAAAHPETNYLGIEIERALQLFTATRLAKRGLGNVRLARGDARVVLRDHVSEASLQAIHVYFPDPWWKQRHRKRRLFTEEFSVQCRRVLRPGGRLHVATDVAEYFETIEKILAGHPALRRLPGPAIPEPHNDLACLTNFGDYLTNFERKYRQEARPIYRAIYERRPD